MGRQLFTRRASHEMKVQVASRHGTYDFHRLNANGADAMEQIDDLFLMVDKTVGVEFLGHRRVTDLVFFPLIQHPFQTAPVAQLIVPRGCGNPA